MKFIEFSWAHLQGFLQHNGVRITRTAVLGPRPLMALAQMISKLASRIWTKEIHLVVKTIFIRIEYIYIIHTHIYIYDMIIYDYVCIFMFILYVYVYVLAGILLFLIFPDSRKGPQLAPTIRADRSGNQAGTWSNSHPKTGLFSGHQNRMSYFAFVQSEESQRLTKQAGIHKKGTKPGNGRCLSWPGQSSVFSLPGAGSSSIWFLYKRFNPLWIVGSFYGNYLAVSHWSSDEHRWTFINLSIQFVLQWTQWPSLLGKSLLLFTNLW